MLQITIMKIKNLLFLGFLFLTTNGFSQSENFRFKALLNEQPETPNAFAVVNYDGLLERLLADKTVRVKQVTPEWIYIQTSASWINASQKSGLIKQFYYEFSMPQALNDSSLVKHYVKPVHQGLGGLQTPFTGKDVIIGYVDQGLDHTHPDFQNQDGTTRVLYYWDHTMPVDPDRTPQPYGYGQLFYASDINNGTCPATEEYPTAHGTSVAGTGSSNGLANGRETGMAPDSKIIVVETNFNLPNWTLTVADACDFIFDKADSLGLPAVVNLSVGSYLGSHDGDDPAAILMENLLDEHGGRIIVCAAGNSGAWGKYHVAGDMDNDTSFVWMIPNPGNQLGANTCYMDVWADLSDATWSYSFGANLSSGTFEERGETQYRLATSVTSGVVRDTIWNGSNRIATVEIYPEIIGNNLHIEYFFNNVDSTTYYYSFKTTGSGHYDAWTGSASIALTDMESNIPSSGVLPEIVNYLLPDTLQTIVSSWNCSEKVITVGNVRNRLGHLDGNNNYYQPSASYTSEVGELSMNSSKGPTRHNVVKPDVAACGDVSLSAGPDWLINDPGLQASVSDDHLHVRNGGTSMASPVVAGIAALYLEKCNNGTYQTFKNDLIASAFTDAFTGVVPNYAYGYGKPHALNLLLQSNYDSYTVGSSPMCQGENLTATSTHTIDQVTWSTGDTGVYEPVLTAGDYHFVTYDYLGCISFSDTLNVTLYPIVPVPVITANGTVLSTANYPNLQWYENGTLISGATNDTLLITLPSNSDFTVVATSGDGCQAYSDPYNPSLGIEAETTTFILYPNPATQSFVVLSSENVKQLRVTDLSGKQILILKNVNSVDCSSWSKGSYLVQVETDNGIRIAKFIKE